MIDANQEEMKTMASVLREEPRGLTYKETVDTDDDWFGDQTLAIESHSYMKARVECFAECLQEFVNTLQ